MFVKSDNGPPFQGDEFRKFAEFMGFKPSQTYYEKMPYIVINVNGNMVTAQRNEHKITRNATHLKKVNSAHDELDLDVKSDNGDNTPNNPVRSPIKTRSASGHVPKISARYMQWWTTMDIRLIFLIKDIYTAQHVHAIISLAFIITELFFFHG